MNVTIADLCTITEDVLSTMLGLAPSPAPAPPAQPEAHWLEGSIEIQGRWRGELTIACGPVMAATLASAFFGEPVAAERVDDARAALLELANILAGHVNALMAAPSRITLPRMVDTGSAVEVAAAARAPELVASYSCSGQALIVTLTAVAGNAVAS